MKKLLFTILLLLTFGNILKSQIENPTDYNPDKLKNNSISNLIHKNLSADFIKSGNFQHIVGIDCGININPSPLNWTSITSEGSYSSFYTETGGEAIIELEITTAANSYAYNYDAQVNNITIPMHRVNLDDIRGNLFHFGSNSEIYLKFKGLEPLEYYDVWMFGVRDGGYFGLF